MKNEASFSKIDDNFDTVQGSKYFTKLALNSGYNQVRVQDEDVAKSATPMGHYEFKVIGFGHCNAPATFQSLMNDVVRPSLRKFVVVLLDGILIFSRNWKERARQARTLGTRSNLETSAELQTFKVSLRCNGNFRRCITRNTIAPN